MSRSIKRLKGDFAPSPYRLWYNRWVSKNAKGKVLDVGKSTSWDYGFPTLDINKELKPTFIGNIEDTAFPDGYFDVVLCNGIYEYIDNPQKMIDECLRICKGTVIFGFVGRDYKPYKKNWKYYEGKEKLPKHEMVNFGNKYHFIICQK